MADQHDRAVCNHRHSSQQANELLHLWAAILVAGEDIRARCYAYCLRFNVAGSLEQLPVKWRRLDLAATRSGGEDRVPADKRHRMQAAFNQIGKRHVVMSAD